MEIYIRSSLGKLSKYIVGSSLNLSSDISHVILAFSARVLVQRSLQPKLRYSWLFDVA
jgi:hypothetical protein